MTFYFLNCSSESRILVKTETSQPATPIRDKNPEPSPMTRHYRFFPCLYGRGRAWGGGCSVDDRSAGPNFLLWQGGIKVELEVLGGNGEKMWGCLRASPKQRINVGTLVITCSSGTHLWMGCLLVSPVGPPQNTAAWTSLLEGLIQWVSFRKWDTWEDVFIVTPTGIDGFEIHLPETTCAASHICCLFLN